MLIRSAIRLFCKNPLFLLKRQLHRKGGKLVTMKIDSPEFHRLFTPELEKLVGLFNKHQHELRIAGGAVRDLLLGRDPHDIDFATTATPVQMKAMFTEEEIRMINNKGEKHGTITARINDKENFEVTTLRIDVVTDGRHAQVEFTKDWQLDANRRDLTINAMFLGFDGTLYDYFNGREDLKIRKIRFVGNAVERIQEDYLRILRYFRFYGRIATSPNDHEPGTLEAFRDNAIGLDGISGERIWMELKKIICGNFSSSIMETMIQLGLGSRMGLPSNVNIEKYKSLWDRSHHLSPFATTLLSGLLRDEAEAYNLNKRLKLSSEDLRLALFIIKHRDTPLGDRPMKFCQDLLIDSAGKEPKVKDKICELLKYHGASDLLEEYSKWEPPRFPVTGYDLFTLKVPKGPIFAKTLHELRQIWKESDFEISKEELLLRAEDIVKKATAK